MSSIIFAILKSMTLSGLREEKKRRTRSRISDHATRLFLARGFDAVSIAEIAEAAGVAKMTVTNYFARKEDLALDLQDTFVTAAADAIRDREPGESPRVAVRRHVMMSIEAQDPVIGFSGEAFARLIADSPTLTARLRELHEQRGQALAGALGEGAADESSARLVAAMVGGVLRYLFDRTMALTLDGTGNATISRVVAAEARDAFAALETGLGPE